MKIKTLEVNGFYTALTAMRDPMDSWAKSDTEWNFSNNMGLKTVGFIVGEADKDLSMRLQKAGPEHCKHLRMIHASADIEAPLYWWKQMDCYRAGVEKVSCSTMHTLLKRPFEMSDFCFDSLPGYKVEPKQYIPEADKTIEEWKEYKGCKVSSEGRIIGVHGKEIKGVLHKDGYRFIWFNKKIVPMHRVVAECFCEGYAENLVVNHKDGNKQNNKASNLEWVTQRENIRHSHENHLQPIQSKTYAGKLTKEEREKAIELYNTGKYSQREVGEMFGVSTSVIAGIVNDKYSYSGGKPNLYETFARPVVNELNRYREEYLETDDIEEKQKIWKSIICLLPESFIQKRTIQFSYASLRNIYRQREGHRLKEWTIFREWVRTLPESWMITDMR